MNAGDRPHDLYVGVTTDDFASTPQPGNYTLCQPQFCGAAAIGHVVELECDVGVKGRYVWIQLPGSAENLTICEVEVNRAGK